MSAWLLFALLSPAIFTVVNFIDKYIVEDKVKDYRGIPVYSAIVGLIGGSLLWIIFGKPVLPLFDTAIVLLTGMLTVWGYAFYFRALSTSQTSYIIGLFQIIPVITLVLSFLFLGEIISLTQLLGFFLILTPVLLLSYQPSKEKFKPDPAFYWILLADVFFAVSSVIFKFAVTANSFTKIVSYESWGISIGGLILFLCFPSIRTAFIQTNKTVGRKVIGIMLINESILILAKGIMFLAVSLGSVALVGVIGGTQVFYGIIYGFILTTIAPKIFKEKIDKKSLLKKFFLMAVLFVGIWLVK